MHPSSHGKSRLKVLRDHPRRKRYCYFRRTTRHRTTRFHPHPNKRRAVRQSTTPTSGPFSTSRHHLHRMRIQYRSSHRLRCLLRSPRRSSDMIELLPVKCCTRRAREIWNDDCSKHVKHAYLVGARRRNHGRLMCVLPCGRTPPSKTLWDTG